jgi:cell division protein FtsZ
MMGTSTAAGTDRARVAAEQAVASPLLEGVDLSGARGVLVNITASPSLKMRETREVMNTIREFAAEDATVIFGTVCEESMGDGLRVTVVATGLGKAVAKKAPLTVLRSGTDSAPASSPPAVHGSTHDYSHLDTPAVWRSRDGSAVRAVAVDEAPAERLDIPAFLRKQAD